jgi:2-keto-4-pentenoate hydratase/2-oxohepta-3-ene-1,7-dioic acid hydratase in catechol pathway
LEGTAAQMIHHVPEQTVYEHIITLRPGDVIATAGHAAHGLLRRTAACGR